MAQTTKHITDPISTSLGELRITFLGHGSLLLQLPAKVIYVDVFGEVADYSKLPKADFVLITHEHLDHLDPKALDLIRKPETILIYTPKCAQVIAGGQIMKNFDTLKIDSIQVTAVPAYNLVHMRNNGQPFHPKGVGNGYILAFGDTRVYIAGDTEDIPEMLDLKDISIAFLPMNLPYTMTPEMAARAAKALKPRILYPYHFGKTDTSLLLELLKDYPEIEVRIRNMA